MEVILLQKVENLGALGNVVNVRPGYARNCLIPQGKAKMATAANMAEVEARRAELEADAAAALAAAEARKAQLDGLVLTIKAKAGNEGKLFGSVSSHEIADREIRLNDGSLRHVGEFEVTLHLHTEVNVNIKVIVEAE